MIPRAASSRKTPLDTTSSREAIQGHESISLEAPYGMRPDEETIASEADAIAQALDANRPKTFGTVGAEPVFGLLGRHLGHSWSPRIHALLGSAPYGLFEREPDELAAFFADGSWRGINVTIPYKKEAYLVANEATKAAKRLGVANTLIKDDAGRIVCDNTDLWGFSWMLNRFCEHHLDAGPRELLMGRKVLVLGSGGACQAIQAVLQDVGAQVIVISRRGPERYETLLERHKDATLLVNTTPVGMWPDCPASPLTHTTLPALRELRGVLDVVYNPKRTALVLQAERLGLPAEGGLAMLCAQAFRSSERFQNRELPEDLLERTLATIVKDTLSVYFIGMPGAGKTGCARRFAHLVDRPFVDLDDSFEVQTGKTAGEYIVENGEARFRDVETRILSEIAKTCGLVVACGGGIVERAENLDLLRQNGLVIFLDRPLEELSLEGRPLSAVLGIETIAARRMERYREWADIALSCTGTAEGDALLAKELLGL